MIKTFPIDFVRQALEQKMFEEHVANPNLFGGSSQVNILSFYEQLKSQDEVDRFVETYRDLTEQQNRTGLILNGVLVSPENPTITNLYSSMIIPMTFTCSLRSKLSNRDQSIETINNLIEKLKGRKVDIAQLKCRDEDDKPCYKPFVVGTIGQGLGQPKLKNGDFVGDVENANQIATKISNLSSIVSIDENLEWVYAGNDNKIKVAKKLQGKGEQLVDGSYEDDILEDGKYIVGSYSLLGEWTVEQLYPNASAWVYLYGNETYSVQLTNGQIEIVEVFQSGGQTYTKVSIRFELSDYAERLCPGWEGTFDIEDVEVWEELDTYVFIENDGSYNNIIFPPEHESFEKYKLSFSFDAIRCDEPRNLNGDEYCELSFGGSATLVNEKTRLGNDLIKVGIKRSKLKRSNGTLNYTDAIEYLEPLELPSGNNANTQISQLVSNQFKTNTHTDAIALTLQYTFIADFSFNLIEKLFDYARYGDQSYITPNIIYSVNEIWSSWGDYKRKVVETKIVENVEIENTESDTLTLALTMQIQGEN